MLIIFKVFEFSDLDVKTPNTFYLIVSKVIESLPSSNILMICLAICFGCYQLGNGMKGLGKELGKELGKGHSEGMSAIGRGIQGAGTIGGIGIGFAGLARSNWQHVVVPFLAGLFPGVFRGQP